jgi:hypothetical protein
LGPDTPIHFSAGVRALRQQFYKIHLIVINMIQIE